MLWLLLLGVLSIPSLLCGAGVLLAKGDLIVYGLKCGIGLWLMLAALGVLLERRREQAFERP